MGWTPGYRGYPAAMRRAILTANPTCQCQGCPACTPTGCGRAPAEVDHRIPHSQGGPTTLDNAQALCRDCHWNKTRRETAAARNQWKRKPEPHPAYRT